MHVGSEFLKVIQEWDDLIRKGEVDRVRSEMEQISKLPPVEHRLAFAQLCRRVGLYHKAMEILSADIQKPVVKNIDPSWVGEYAVNLQRVGAVSEALRVLEDSNSESRHSALAYCHMNLWDYESAEESWKAHLLTVEDDYQRLVAEVNLAACMICRGSYGDAVHLLDEVILKLKAKASFRLLANCYELLAQAHIGQGRLDKAKTDVLTGLYLYGNQGMYDSFFLSKWSSIIEALESESIDELLKVRDQAEKQGLWEAVRDIEYQSLQIRYDENVRDRLFVGSRSVHYRKRVENRYGKPAINYVMNPGVSDAFIVESGLAGSKVIVEPESEIHALLKSLFSDLYSSRKIGQLFGDVYPEENFDVFESPAKIYKLVEEVRKILLQSRLGIKIEEHYGDYRIEVANSQTVELANPAAEDGEGLAKVIQFSDYQSKDSEESSESDSAEEKAL